MQCPGSSTEYPPPGNLVANGFDNGVPANWFCPFCVSGLVIESDATSTYAAANAANRNGVEDAGVGVSVYNLVPGQSHLFYAWVSHTAELPLYGASLVLWQSCQQDHWSESDVCLKSKLEKGCVLRGSGMKRLCSNAAFQHPEV